MVMVMAKAKNSKILNNVLKCGGYFVGKIIFSLKCLIQKLTPKMVTYENILPGALVGDFK